LIVVVFPAPFGPKNPKILPELMARSILSTAVVDPYDFESDFAMMHDI